jgi:DNA-binding transcriptional ArsR family regulator
LSENEPEPSTNPELKMKMVHELYLRAVNNPLRRRILEALSEGKATSEELSAKTGLDEAGLNWHLSILENSICVEREDNQGHWVFKLTQAGKVIDYLES